MIVDGILLVLQELEAALRALQPRNFRRKGSWLEPSSATLGASGPGRTDSDAGCAPPAPPDLPPRPLDVGRRFALLSVPEPLSVVDGNTEAGEVAFVSTGQEHLPDIWTFGTRTGASSQRSRINPGLQRYELGSARPIEWQSRDGEPRAGTLLLPPGYREGERLPLVVWVYGGLRGSRYSRRGSDSINRFGMVSSAAFNMHVLAARGYAVFFPNAPIRMGSPIADVMESVMTGVDAAIEQG